jgi:hypothetical protein
MRRDALAINADAQQKAAEAQRAAAALPSLLSNSRGSKASLSPLPPMRNNFSARLLSLHCAYPATSPGARHPVPGRRDTRPSRSVPPGSAFAAQPIRHPKIQQTTWVHSAARCTNPSGCQAWPCPSAKQRYQHRCRDSCYATPTAAAQRRSRLRRRQ